MTDVSETRVVYWVNCNCEWITKYCEDNHRRSVRVPLAVLEAAWDAANKEKGR